MEGESKTAMKYLYDPPKLLKMLYPSFIWNSACGKVVITFDDGPNPNTTELILKRLNDNSIKSIFFCVGNNINKYPQIATAIVEEGHLIGNHTYNHKILTRINYSETINELRKTNEIIQNVTGQKPLYFRPPHGRFKLSSNKIIAECGLKNVMWSCLTFDYKNKLNIVKFAVQNYLKNNSIVVFHDSIKNKDIINDSISVLIDEISIRGFELGKPQECLN